jgi:hypothetical protein
MFKLIFWGFLLYLLYKFIFELVIPVSKATKNIRAKMQEQQQFMEAERYRKTNSPVQTTTPEKKPRSGSDYIEFEEIKS